MVFGETTHMAILSNIKHLIVLAIMIHDVFRSAVHHYCPSLRSDKERLIMCDFGEHSALTNFTPTFSPDTAPLILTGPLCHLGF